MTQQAQKVLIACVITLIALVLCGYFLLSPSSSRHGTGGVTSSMVPPADVSAQSAGKTSSAAGSTTVGYSISTNEHSVPAQSLPALPPAKKPAAVVTPDAALPIGDTRFIVSLDGTSTDTVADSLMAQGFITSTSTFESDFNAAGVAPGAYRLSTSTMSTAQIAETLKAKPYMKWVVIPEGLRKEEIAALLAKSLGWTAAQTNTFITVDTASPSEDIEGVYFPDTYLIPLGESTSDTAKRLISKFNEEFAPYLPLFNAQNIKWTTALTMASLVQREAGSDADMPIIAGILWNRLDQGMALDIDATLQYARGNTGNGWWAPITVADKQIDSPYNTYMNKGLPPHPIANPGLPAIEATLNPAKTDCLYYIHDSHQVIHCAATYAEQQQNIDAYLKNS